MIKGTSHDYPPNWGKIKEAFPNCVGKACFCYSDHIYNPFKLILTPDLCEHEEQHSISQGNDPEKWWDRYMTDDQFRLDEEVKAFSAQLQFLKKNIRAKYYKEIKDKIAFALSGELYNLGIDFHKAESLIRNYGKGHGIIKG